MSQTGLKQEILDSIMDRPVLFGKVAEGIGVGVLRARALITGNDPRLTQFSIMKLIADELKIEDMESMLIEQETSVKTA